MKTRFRVRCRRAAYLLNRLVRAGVSASNVEIESGSLSFSVRVGESSLVQKVLAEEGFEYERSGYLGGKAALRRVLSRPFLVLSVLIALVGVIFFESFVYDFTIRGNLYVTTESIAMVLRDNRLDGFTAKRDLDLSRIKREIGALDGVSFASVKVVGTHLDVEIKEELPSSEPIELIASPILASHSALVTRIVAEQGTPRVSVGDRVEAGALLIEPIYAFAEGGTPAPARGEVWGLVTYSEEVILPLLTVEHVRTGRTATTRTLRLFGRTIGGDPEPPFASAEVLDRVIFSSFGVSVLEHTYYEMGDQTILHDFDREAPLVLNAAAQSLLLRLPCDAQERGVVRATQKKLDNILITVLYYRAEQRIDSLSLVP